MKKTMGYVQLGKNGITENFVETLKSYFKNHRNIKISVLRSAIDSENKKSKVNQYSREILDKLGRNYTSKIIGFTIVVKKWKKPMR